MLNLIQHKTIKLMQRSGKTTLMKKIADELTDQNRRVQFITFDDVSILQMFEQDIESFKRLYVAPNEFLFIDEIQYAAQSGSMLKYIYDTTEVKIFISGSSAIELSVQSIKYLVGRIFTFTLFPFSFREFLRAKDTNLITLYDDRSYGRVVVQKLNGYMREFLLYGGFPRVITSEHLSEKKDVLLNIYNTYLLHEIKDIFQLGNDYQMINLLKLLALQTGNLVNFNELALSSGINIRNLKKYINILEKTFILSLVKPFHSNKRIEIVKSPKVYFIDPGFRNVCIDNFSGSLLESGEVFEQYVFTELCKNEKAVKYWRTKSGAEVDFILDQELPVPIEVKTNMRSEKISRAFHSFIEKYKPSQSYYFSLEFEKIKQHNQTSLHFLPLVKLNELWK